MKASKRAHTPMTQKGMGDFYGSGVRQKVGKIRDVTGYEKLGKSQNKKPKSLA